MRSAFGFNKSSYIKMVEYSYASYLTGAKPPNYVRQNIRELINIARADASLKLSKLYAVLRYANKRLGRINRNEYLKGKVFRLSYMYGKIEVAYIDFPANSHYADKVCSCYVYGSKKDGFDKLTLSEAKYVVLYELDNLTIKEYDVVVRRTIK